MSAAAPVVTPVTPQQHNFNDDEQALTTATRTRPLTPALSHEYSSESDNAPDSDRGAEIVVSSEPGPVPAAATSTLEDLATSRNTTAVEGLLFRCCPKRVLRKMVSALRELVLMCLVLIACASLTSRPPKITKTPAAYPFFSADSVTLDFYRGHIASAFEYARDSDLSFVMFYAPWDAASQETRAEFERAARFLRGRVAFTAVNCWQPGGQCRKQYGKVYSWPVLIAYAAHGRGVQYNGPRRSQHIIGFLENMIAPVVRVTSFEDAVALMGKHNIVVLVSVSAHPGSQDYLVAYNLAYRLLEVYPFQDVVVAVYTSPASAEPEMFLNMWNETLVYPVDNQWAVKPLFQWILKHIHLSSMWVSPLGTKSSALLQHFNGQPTLVLFTPRNPLLDSIDYYQMLRQISLKYYNCGSETLQLIDDDTIRTQRLEFFSAYKNQLRACLSGRNKDTHAITESVTISHSKLWHNKTDCNYDQPGNTGSCGQCNQVCTVDSPKACPTLLKRTKTSMLNDIDDPKSPANIKKHLHAAKCMKLTAALKLSPPAFSGHIYGSKNKLAINITGLSCSSNSSMNIIAVDSLVYARFASRLGIDLASMPEKTAAVIVSESLESHFLLPGPLTEESLEGFLHNFTSAKLLRSAIATSPVEDECSDAADVCVQELHSHNFLDTVLQSNKTVIVYYYSPQCAFCSGISHAFLGAARRLRFARSVRFVRIDADGNTFPWPFTMPAIPMVLALPAAGSGRSKADSCVLPAHVPITVPHLVQFVVGAQDRYGRLETLWSICVTTTIVSKQKECFTRLRLDMLAVIERTLRDWRLAVPRLRRRILRRLQHLRQLHLLLAHSPGDLSALMRHFALHVPS